MKTREERLWEAACASMAGWRAAETDEFGPLESSRAAYGALEDAEALVAEWERRTRAGGGWYCPKCNETREPTHVTFEETCAICGAVVFFKPEEART